MPVVRLHQVAGDHRLIVKRIIDIVGAAAGLVALSPVLLLCAIAIRLTSPGPVVFSQVRYGFNRRRFRMYKFRTMVQNAERLQADLESRNEAQGPVFKIKADPRITKVGGFLRRTSLDELPQLFNVLTGDMSLVGPRPLAVRDVARFDAGWLMRRFSVKPGLTCLWQVNGRSDTDFERWVQLDLHYIDNWSLALDMRILIKTVPAVFSGTGAM
jgi:exopolysaccharide biosynthesis polyprenyl glycosylphosphotransferase